MAHEQNKRKRITLFASYLIHVDFSSFHLSFVPFFSFNSFFYPFSVAALSPFCTISFSCIRLLGRIPTRLNVSLKQEKKTQFCNRAFVHTIRYIT